MNISSIERSIAEFESRTGLIASRIYVGFAIKSDLITEMFMNPFIESDPGTPKRMRICGLAVYAVDAEHHFEITGTERQRPYRSIMAELPYSDGLTPPREPVTHDHA